MKDIQLLKYMTYLTYKYVLTDSNVLTFGCKYANAPRHAHTHTHTRKVKTKLISPPTTSLLRATNPGT